MQVAKILATEVIRLVERSGGGLTTLLDLISLQPSEEKFVLQIACTRPPICCHISVPAHQQRACTPADRASCSISQAA